MNNKHKIIEQIEHVEDLSENEKIIERINNFTEALQYFYEINDIETRDYLNLEIFDTQNEDYKYLFMDLSRYETKYCIDGVVNYTEFILELKKSKLKMYKLSEENILIEVNTRKNKVLSKR